MRFRGRLTINTITPCGKEPDACLLLQPTVDGHTLSEVRARVLHRFGSILISDDISCIAVRDILVDMFRTCVKTVVQWNFFSR